MQSTAKVGLLLAVFVALLIGGYAVLGKSIFAPKPDVYFADLSDAGGVSEGTPVLMAGVDIGLVTQIKLLNPKMARLRLEISKGTHIPEGSTLQLGSSLISFGESPVMIIPPETVGDYFIAPGATLDGSKGSPLESILPGSKDTIKELNKTMIAVRKLLEDQKLQGKVSDILVTSNKTLERFGTLANNASALISANQSNISRALISATAAINDVHKVTMRVVELIQDGKLKKDANALIDEIKKISAHADSLLVSMNNLVTDPKLRTPISQSANNIAEITNTGKEIATNAAAITKNGVAISENAAVVSKKAIALTDKATDVATKASEIEDQLKGVLDKVGGFFSKAPSGKDIPKITTEMDLMRQSRPGYWRTDLTFSVPISDQTLSLGLYDALESNRLTVELGKPLTDRLSYRYGIYAGEPGVGVDYRLAPKLWLRGDAWNINGPELTLRANYEFGNGFIGWLGVDSVLRANALTAGIGIRR